VPFDDKLQPAEALIALKSMTDQNIPFVMHAPDRMSARR
jgi:branched-chain amino acid transport system substrate-binding protein